MSSNAISAVTERAFGCLPTWARDAGVALACTCLAVFGRLIVDQFSPDLSPFTLVFPCAILAALLAGGWAGSITIVLCQVLAWYFVVPPRGSFALNGATFLMLLISTLSLAVTVWGVAAYRSALRKLSTEQEKRVDFLSTALAEFDHRTKNNFQIAASLLMSQAMSHHDPMLKEELERAAGRLQSVAGVYSSLALSSVDLSTVALHEHLREICDRVVKGLLPGAVKLRFTADPVEVPAQTAVSVGLIVNECLTNAVKHAFPTATGEILVTLSRGGDSAIICIADDGIGASGGDPEGTGSKLIKMLARSVNAKFKVKSDEGMLCELTLPLAPDLE